MASFCRPSPKLLDSLLSLKGSLPFSYVEAGCTRGAHPAGYVEDVTHIELGVGANVFRAAKSALQAWRQLRLGWMDVGSPEAELQTGQLVVILVQAFGMWWCNPCRIVYCLDELEPLARFGFATGTLPGHVAQGEERFLIEWNRETDVVKYEILAISRPKYVLARLGYPLLRRYQKRFGRESAQAMFCAVQSHAPCPVIFQSTKWG